MNRKPIIVFGTIDNQQKELRLIPERFTQTIYNIMIDDVYHGQVIRMVNGWGVYPHDQSSLKGKNCDFIVDAVLNTGVI